MFLKKKSVALWSLIILIGIAALLNYQYNLNSDRAVSKETETGQQGTEQLEDASSQESTSAEEVAQTEDSFISYKLERDKMRSESIETLKEIVENEKTTDQTRDDAQKQMMELLRETEKETIVENLIKAKGFEDALVFIDDSSVNVIIESAKDLTPADVAQISDIVNRETGIAIENIKIMKRQ
ncbi:MAG: SpoIIIAH-like family protein [Thermoanaerobacteraceae bacterium]|nr:SpoIIIAH-like family protein [Thermoanaerobacteraceae bacterium]